MVTGSMLQILLVALVLDRTTAIGVHGHGLDEVDQKNMLVWGRRNVSTPEFVQNISELSSTRSLIFDVNPIIFSEDSSLLVEAWYDMGLRYNNRPALLLAAKNGEDPEVSLPTEKDEFSIVADSDTLEALYTDDSYHFLVLDQRRDWRIGLFNLGSPPSDILVRFSIVPSAQSCPTGRIALPGSPPNSSVTCSGKGSCLGDGACQCYNNFGGRYCEEKLYSAPTTEASSSISYESIHYFEFEMTRRGSLAAALYVENAQSLPDVRSVPFVGLKRPYENGGMDVNRMPLLNSGPPLPSVYDVAFLSVSSCHAVDRPYMVRTASRAGEVFIAAIFARLPGTDPVSAVPKADIIFRVFECGEQGEPACPYEDCSNLNMKVLAPLIFGIALILVAATLLVIFMRLRVRRSTARLFGVPMAKMTRKELDRRFPSSSYIVEDMEEGSSSADCLSCSICLMEFADGDCIRRLPCEHFFHRDCLDDWMVLNPTCPCCRADFIPTRSKRRVGRHRNDPGNENAQEISPVLSIRTLARILLRDEDSESSETEYTWEEDEETSDSDELQVVMEPQVAAELPTGSTDDLESSDTPEQGVDLGT